MGTGIIALAIIIILIVLLINVVKIGIKIALFIVLAIAVAGTIYVCTQQPDMHKAFSIDTIEYLLKINKDGSITTTKQVTQTVQKDN